ncbi:MAG: hypothetical protein IJV67_00080 [Clostridia bacterium]|nr:hypothetical protein [Clostridia bacterium]
MQWLISTIMGVLPANQKQKSDWAKITINNYNSELTNATRYYYSETQPTVAGKYWHYVNGVPTAW